MRLIDRYVFSLFLKVFLVCFLSLTGIYIVGDFVGNLNEFIEAADQQGSLVSLLTTYYGARVPWFFDLVGRVVALIAAVFAVTWLQRHNEMTALMAAGHLTLANHQAPCVRCRRRQPAGSRESRDADPVVA